MEGERRFDPFNALFSVSLFLFDSYRNPIHGVWGDIVGKRKGEKIGSPPERDVASSRLLGSPSRYLQHTDKAEAGIPLSGLIGGSPRNRVGSAW